MARGALGGTPRSGHGGIQMSILRTLVWCVLAGIFSLQGKPDLCLGAMAICALFEIADRVGDLK